MRTLACCAAVVSIAVCPTLVSADAVFVGQIMTIQTTDAGGTSLPGFARAGRSAWTCRGRPTTS